MVPQLVSVVRTAQPPPDCFVWPQEVFAVARALLAASCIDSYSKLYENHSEFLNMVTAAACDLFTFVSSALDTFLASATVSYTGVLSPRIVLAVLPTQVCCV